MDYLDNPRRDPVRRSVRPLFGKKLRIQSGTDKNAVKTQIWVAASMYVLVAIVRKRFDLQASLYTLLQVISVTVFEKMPLLTALSL